MFSLNAFHRSRDRVARTVVLLSLCPTLQPLQAIETLAAAGCHGTSGPGWYDSSWDLSCGLDIAEVTELDAWIDACMNLGPLSVLA